MNTQTVTRAPRNRPVALVFWMLSAAMVVGSADARKVTAAQKCTAAKRKLVGREIAALTACDATAVARGVVVDPACRAKARSRFVTAWGKAEKAADGACITSDDVTTIGVVVDAHAADLEATLGLAGAASKCIAGKLKAVGKDDTCELGCQAKAAARGVVVDEQCLAACTKRFTAACAKSESKDDCRTMVGCGALAALADVFVADVTSALPVAPTTTSTTTSNGSSTTSTSSTTVAGATSSTSSTTVIGSTTTSTTMATVVCGTFVTKWGTLGTGNGQFDDPELLAVDADGNVFVPDAGSFATDANTSRIQKFTGDGSFLTAWGSPGVGAGQFVDPQAVAVDGAGNVFVADAGADRIQKFTNGGTFLTAWGSSGAGDGQFSGPAGVAVDANGNVFVADGLNNRIQKFTNTGTFLTKWGSLGLGAGQFSDNESITVDANGNVFVADVDRIQKFTNDGTFVTEWGSLGNGDGQFNSVLGVAAGPAGSIYTTDFNHRVQKFACP